MNLIFMRHGEATDNVNELISDKEIYWSTLTDDGIKVVLETVKYLPKKIDKVYVSPFPRTVQTANLVYKRFSDCDFIIDNRLHEIYHGKYSGQRNNEDLDNTRVKQINNDFFVRFGSYGENKYDIESRLCSFLVDLYKSNLQENTVVIISHGSITSFMKRILKIQTPHLKTGKIEEFLDVDFNPLFEYIKYLRKVRNNQIKKRKEVIGKLRVSEKIKSKLNLMNVKEFNNIEFSDDVFDNYTTGLSTKNLIQKTKSKFDKSIILVCFYNNFENFADKWINHYIEIGVKNFVLVDNNSSDNSTKILQKYSKKVNISFWSINEPYNCYKMCGWKQRIFEHFGINRYYLVVDSDELFIYENYQSININNYVSKSNVRFVKAIMLDVYSKNPLIKSTLEEMCFVDSGTYKISENVPYGQRIYGGPRKRVFGIKPSLQKIPLSYYSGNELYINDHYFYPWQINKSAKLNAALLHYKFLPGDMEKYEKFVEDGRHWNNSREYKVYCEYIKNNNAVSFYDESVSVNISDINFRF